MSGPAASGKTLFAKELARSKDLTIVDLDDSLDQLILREKENLEEFGMEKFLTTVAPARYLDLIERAVKLFTEGKSLVVVAPFTSQIGNEDLWEKMISPFTSLRVTPRLIWINTDVKSRVQRLRQRGSQRDVEKLNNLDDYVSKTQVRAPVVPYLEVNGTQDFKKFIVDNF